ncbi:uncharacterized protein LAESUDRAFT_725728 [Laetiporus sulphureus 93-53]|uniref:Uncharacterized protein n=1 Tax=Laetiporus sulphureus 93-53 TaxID=1314785 RepID=A0A165EB29_9APHY|nr:uncharacterized protein LAESUDRAFT_725728 [Laetiporus sulphureus 93-53]KZT06635.1 hypothetical protein LAESUDRAFT_725728 [Laetiporus sulphureus 93-53]
MRVPTPKKVRPMQCRKAAPRVRRAEEKRIESQYGAETIHLQNGMTLRLAQLLEPACQVVQKNHLEAIGFQPQMINR